MGILPKHLELLAVEHNRTPSFIRGNVLTLGQQSVYATLQEVRRVFTKHHLNLKPLPDDFDTTNKIPSWRGTSYENRTNAQTVLTLMGANSVKVADLSQYEGADYVINLNNNINQNYEQQFDVIFDIGTLEHIFDISTALESIIKMLKPGGRIIIIAPSSNSIDHGFYQFSPTLFYDLFSCNGFENFSCYLLEYNPLNYLRKGKVWRYTGFGMEYPLITPKGVEVFFTATKPTITKDFVKPIQRVYTERAHKDRAFLKKMQGIRDKTWKVVPECIETVLTKHFIGNKNLKYLGKY